MTIRKRIMSVLLAIVLAALSVPVAMATCSHSDLEHRAEGEIRGNNGTLCVEHWYCYDCYRYFADAEATQELTSEEIYSIPCPHDEMGHYEEGETCNSEGYFCREFWRCSFCYRHFADAEATQELTEDEVYSDPCPHSSLRHYEEGEKCDPYGNGLLCVEHWECQSCFLHFADATATQQLTHDEIYSIPCPHNDLRHYEDGESTDLSGYVCVEHWYCPDCCQYYADAAATQTLTYFEVYLKPCQHNDLMHFNAGSDIDISGYACIEHWYCPDCYQYYADEAATQRLLYNQVYFCSHSGLTHYAAGEVSNSEGHLCTEHWYCQRCGSYFADAAATQKMTEAEVFSSACSHSSVSHLVATTPFCGTTGTIDCWRCNVCNQYFADEAATQPLSYEQVAVPAPYDEHTFLYEVGFTDEENDHEWLSTTSYREKQCQEEYGMTVAEKFVSDGYTAFKCDHCGVVIQKDGTDRRPEDLGFLLNPIPELADTVKIPISPEGLAAGEKWLDYGSELNLYYIEFYGEISEKTAAPIALALLVYVSNDYYYNEATQQVFAVDGLFNQGSIQELTGMECFIRTVGDDENVTVLPSSPEGLATGQKWFDAAAFCQDLIGAFIPAGEEEAVRVEDLISRILAGSFVLSADGSEVFTVGSDTGLIGIAEEAYVDSVETEVLEMLHGGSWFIPLRIPLFGDAGAFNTLDYVKTVEGSCDHLWDDGIVTKEATCASTGVKTFTCTLCSNTKTEVIPAQHGLINGFDEDSAVATCKNPGFYMKTCLDCNKVVESQAYEKDANNHANYGTELKNAREATCTADGYTGDTVCKGCGAVLQSGTLIPAEHGLINGFDEDSAVATCKNPGFYMKTCLDCNKVVESQAYEKDANNHANYGAEVRNASDPTCTEAGYTGDTVCLGCGAVLQGGTVIPAKGHTWGAWVVVAAPTYLNEGMQTRKCQTCQTEETAAIPKLVPDRSVTDTETGSKLEFQEGVVPEDTQIVVDEEYDGTSFRLLNNEKGNVKKVLFNITLESAGGKIQPNGKVLVKIPIPDGFNPERLFVYYISGDENRMEKIDCYVENGFVCFETDHFSDYAIVEESPAAAPTAEPQNDEPAPKLNFFQRIIQWFKNLFAKLFGR